MRKVLLVSYHFPPSQAVAVHRMLGLVRNLPALGWQPIVVAPPNVPGDPEDSGLVKFIPAGTPVYHVPFPTGFFGKVLRKFAPRVCWLPAAWSMCREVVRQHRPDAVLTTSPPVCIGFLGEHLKKRHGLPWLADYRDPSYACNPYRKVPIGRFHWETRLEWRTMRLADQILANTPIMHEGLQAAYPEHAHKIQLVTNGFDRDIVPQTPPPAIVNDELTIVHAGELYLGRDPRPFFDALQQLRHEQPNQRWRLRLLGQSHCGGNLTEELRKRDLENIVRLEGQVNYAQALHSMSDAHILLVVHTPGVKLSIPAKMFEYLAAGRPILALAEPDGDIAWLLKSAGVRHRTALLKNVEQIKQALCELRGELQADLAPPIPWQQMERFSRQHMAELVAECLDRCVPNPSGAAQKVVFLQPMRQRDYSASRAP